MEQITSRSNPLVAHLRKLGASRAYRTKQREFCCDGWKLLEEALLWNGQIKTILTAQAERLPKQLPDGIRLVSVPETLLSWLSPLEQAQGCVFSCTMPEDALPEQLSGRRYALLDGLQDPGNVGTILRTAAAFSLDGVFLTGHCADLWNPKTLRATMGAAFRLPVWQGTYEAVSGLLGAAGLPLYGAALGEACQDVRKINWTRAAVAIGSEGSGLSQALLERCDGRVQIPMDPRCESLNAAVAASLVFWEMSRGEEGALCPH